MRKNVCWLNYNESQFKQIGILISHEQKLSWDKPNTHHYLLRNRNKIKTIPYRTRRTRQKKRFVSLFILSIFIIFYYSIASSIHSRLCQKFCLFYSYFFLIYSMIAFQLVFPQIFFLSSITPSSDEIEVNFNKTRNIFRHYDKIISRNVKRIEFLSEDWRLRH